MSEIPVDPSQRVLVDLEYIKRDVADIKRSLENKFVTQDQFEPIKRIVYGLVSIVLTAFVVAVVALVLK